MPLFLRIALVHLTGRKRQTLMSLLGIALGVAFFMAVSSLMRGSEQDFIDRLIDASPHITVSDEFREPPRQPAITTYPEGAVAIRHVQPRTEVRGIRGYKQRLAAIETIPGLRVAPVLTGQAIVTFAGKGQGVTLNGVIPEMMSGVSNIDDKFVEGNLEAIALDPNGVIVGKGLIDKLNLGMGDNVTVSSPTGLVRTMKIVGVFETGTTSVDESQAYVLLKRAQVLLDQTDRANRLVIQLDDPYSARTVAGLVEARVGYKAQSWQEASENLMSVLLIRNIIMYSVVSAILVVASFGIFNVISTVVMEKQRDIAILKSVGFHARDVRRIFLAEGAAVGLMGSLAGTALGYGLIAVLGRVEMQPPGSSQTITLPVYWGVDQIALAVLFALFSAVGAAYLPARKAGGVHPVDILRGGMA
ncbi:Lipoprotein-releasing system transmembrane protein LolE [Hartmannibacter diazotrophicus]|uniref:Lipoprotein-releasing system transmembrane protein LolE n=1 Tax=Hartmannibacter diazotrophicus TaxID=1482074 RepID=A0A2C9DDB5_9HYPH|nr:ABC transporter permease [Hartmannibacter diazotrophicus]SON58332.1 Lipoprotein-releasing system transmembrane protein LolE [Hartmannibacter diazotrophicus]